MQPLQRETGGSNRHSLFGAAALDRLNLIGRSVDWEGLSALLGGVAMRADRPIPFDDEVMLRAMLLQQWFALGALEFEHELGDRRSFQRFTKTLEMAERPDYVTVNAFRNAVLTSGLAPALEKALAEEFSQAGITSAPRPDLPSPTQITGVQAEMLASPYIRSPEWLRLENDFFDFLGENHPEGIATAYPNLPSRNALRRQFITIDVVEGGADFVWTFVGEGLVQTNSNDVSGNSLRDRADACMRGYGHYGIQGEFISLFERSLRDLSPVTSATYFHNAGGVRCQIWITVAPLDTLRPRHLAGVALIEPVHRH
jgi:hypothetical protein